MQIEFIYARDDNHGIAKDGELPWNSPEDLKRFSKITKENCRENGVNPKPVVIMGRKTWEALPSDFQPLPKRLNIILSRKMDSTTFNFSTKVCLHKDIQECLCYLEQVKFEKAFIIGGGEIFKIFEPYVTAVHESHIFGDFNCNTIYSLNLDSFIPEKIEEVEDHKYTLWRKKDASP